MLKVCVNAVDKVVKIVAQTLKLITSFHNFLLEISHEFTGVVFLDPVSTQQFGNFTQPFSASFPLLRVVYSPLSPTHNDANKLNKGIYL